MKNTFLFVFLAAFFISCAQLQEMSDSPEKYDSERDRVLAKKVEKRDINLPEGSTMLDGDSGLGINKLFSGSSSVDFGVDSITFRVALDKISFMPLLSVDSLSGVIVTDWYSLDDGNSRIKINIRVIDQEMTNESLSVSLFTQSRSDDQWIDNGINSEQSLKIKESILSSSRALKIASEL